MKKYSAVFIICILKFCFAQNVGARYLIITHDSYYNFLISLADWKTQKGYKAKIVTLSEIGGSDSVSIRNYIVNAYNTWQVKPEYLLLVGNKNQIPFPECYYPPYFFKSDNYYTNVAGDYHNEILSGRIWVFDTNQIKTVIAKILNYEKNPYCLDSLWFRKSSTIVVEDLYPPYADSIYWSDAWFAQNLMRNAGFVRIDTFSRILGDNDTDVIDAWNNGRSYIHYRGMGDRHWATPFSNIDTCLMNNGFKLPIIISATCLTIEDIGYIWLFAGSPEQPKGCVGFLGTTAGYSNAAAYRSALARGTMSNIFTDSMSTLGKAAEAGRMNYVNTFDSTLEYACWTCMGDPEMTVRTANPKMIQVIHSPNIWFGDTMTVQVSYNSFPIESALVCIKGWSDSTIYHWGRTDNAGTIEFVDTIQFSDTAFLTVTGRNIMPFIDTIIGGFQGGPFVKYISHSISDSIGGNDNHQPNNGENVELVTWVRNYGDSTARGVYGILQKMESDGYFQLDDTIKHFGNIPSFDSAVTGSDGFNLIISPICPDSHLIKLKLTITDTLNNNWISFFNVRVFCKRPYLTYQKCLILDSLGGNNDHQINPIENVELPVWLYNIGDSLAETVTGILQKVEADPLFILTDTIKNYGAILPADSDWTGIDGYNICADSQCPDMHQLKLRIKIHDSLDSNWVYDFNLINHAPVLVFSDYMIDDTIKFIRHGDTAQLALFIKNTGSYMADNVFGHLISLDSFLVVQEADAGFGTIFPDSTGNNSTDQFIVRSRSDAPTGYSAGLRLALSAGPYRDTINFSIFIGQRDYLVWDPDPNHSSGFIIHQKLNQLDFLGEYKQVAPLKYFNIYKTLFITLGISPNKYILYDTASIIPEILHFVNAGGKFYLEGGDVWCQDTVIGGYNFCPLFLIRPVSNSSGTCTGLSGSIGSFTEGMNFTYTGESSSLDRLDTLPGGLIIFKDRSNGHVLGVAANHKTVGQSFEYSGLVDSVPPSTKLILIDSIMRYFGIEPSGSISDDNLYSILCRSIGLTIFPNPTRNRVKINFYVSNNYKSGDKIALHIFDVTGRLVRNIQWKYESINASKSADIIWDCTDQYGRYLPSGIYFVCFKNDGITYKKKIILLK